jgi:uncharacterized OB-fold protein
MLSMRIAAQPQLYEGEGPTPPRLNGGRCRSCGYVFFPPQRYGCEVCGAPADGLEPVSLAGKGVLRSFAVVHFHQGPHIQAPFTVASIVLEGGPSIRAVMTSGTGEGLRSGDKVRSVLVPQGTDESGNEVVELRFEKVEER